MALDNANFISELSIVDPPGTDPLSQGDDQIRTIKRATQQSFPNIDAAVTLTAAQLNLAAIKNEANVFTEAQTFNSNISINAATDNAVNIFYTAADINIWSLQMQAVAGDNRSFRFRKHDNITGAFVDVPFQVFYDTSVVDFLNVPTVQGAPIWVAGELRLFVASAAPGTNWFIADGLNGTVNLDNRVLVGEGSNVPGTLLNPNLVGTAASGTSGSTAISEAQMPVHTHRIWSGRTGSGITDSVLGNTAEVTVVGANRGNAQRQFDLNTGFGAQQIIENSGSGNTHTHSVPSRSVTENGTSRDTVRSLSAVVRYHQYVP